LRRVCCVRQVHCMVGWGEEAKCEWRSANDGCRVSNVWRLRFGDWTLHALWGCGGGGEEER